MVGSNEGASSMTELTYRLICFDNRHEKVRLLLKIAIALIVSQHSPISKVKHY